MSDEAIDTLVALARRVREAGDATTADEVMPQAQAIAQDQSLTPSRRLGAALTDLASALVPWGPGPAVQGLFEQAQRVLKAAGDALIDDWLVLWHNLSALYDGHGVPQERDELIAHIVKVAETWAGPLQALGARVLLEEATEHRRHSRIGPMQACLRQTHRFRNRDDQPAADRASWLALYADLLADAGCNAEADPVLVQAIELAHSQGEAQREAELLTRRAAAAVARDDLATAAAAIDRALPLAEQPALAGTRLAAAVWMNLAVVVLRQRTQPRYSDARTRCAQAIELLRNLGQGDSAECAYALYYHAQLSEHLGDRADAAKGYQAAAAVPGAEPADAAEWLSLAGDAWFEGDEFDAASECYLDAIRRRVAIPAK